MSTGSPTLRIYALSTVQAGYDILQLLVPQLPVAGVIGLSPREPGNMISGYRSVREVAPALGLEPVEVQSYNLSDPADQKSLCALEMDLLLVLGWQRLIPQWLIEHARIGVVGVHGSAGGITAGRGRSPQNWALLLGERSFRLSIFFIDSGIDSGRVVASASFPLTEFDDIRSSYIKVGMMTARLLLQHLASGQIQALAGEPQSGPVLYLPQRRPEDGAIDWRRSTAAIHDFVRALSRPYPGAFSFLNGRRITIWQARPFLLPELPVSEPPGTIVQTSGDDAFLVRTGDGVLLVDCFNCERPDGVGSMVAGDQLESADFGQQMRAIVERHEHKYPDLPLLPSLRMLAT